MKIRTAEEAAEAYKTYDDWQYADREAAWKWMFERGVEAANARSYEEERKLFEADAKPYGFDITRRECAAPEPWSEYMDEATGHRWGGWLAARGV